MLRPRTLSLALAWAVPNTAIAAVCGAAISVAAMSSAAQPAERFGNALRVMPQSGEALYADICQGCHMPEGVGAVGAGTYPALARNPKLATAGYPLFLVIHGRKGMPPFGKLLTDQQVAAVVNYIRTHFGNDFPDAVSDDDARAAR
jgi:mono/diheme cytochrome c family protein